MRVARAFAVVVACFLLAGCHEDERAAVAPDASDDVTTVRHPNSECGREVVNDLWQDNKVDAQYSANCYAWALRLLAGAADADGVADAQAELGRRFREIREQTRRSRG